MTTLRQIYRAYVEAEGYLRDKELAARSKRAKEKWARLREINNQAYFVMMFACLQDRIDDLCRRLIRRKKQLVSWRARRRWDRLDPARLERVSFMERVSWLVEKGGSDYNIISDLYEIRCHLAHGAFAQVPPPNVPAFYRQIQAVWKALRP